MKTKQIKLRPMRVYSEEFKRARVAEYESGEFTIKQISTLYKVHFQTVYNWIYKFSVYNKKGIKVVEMADSSTKKAKELQQKIANLERLLGQKQVKLDYFETMFGVAKDTYNLDLKKNSDTPQSK